MLWRAAVAASLFTLIVLLQLRLGAYRSEFAGYPDEAAHYVTGLMMHDYIVGGKLTSPEEFARNYYLHYPKVAIGHWPPFFYIVQAAWTLIFPASRASLLLLMASLTALVAFTLYRAVAAEMGEIAGIAAGLFFVALPTTQESSAMVMDDMLVALLALLAVLRFARFMDQGRARDALLFGLFSSATILTKGSGLALAGVPIIALAVTSRWKLLRRPAFWLPVAVVVPLCGPWYWLTRQMLQKPAFDFIGTAIRFYALHSLQILGVVLFGLVLLGFTVRIIAGPRREVGAKWAVLAALLVSIGLLACVAPILSIGGQQHVLGTEERFLVPSIPAILAFGVAGMDYLVRRLAAGRLSLNAARIILILVIGGTLVPNIFSKTIPVSFGFSSAAKYVLSQPGLNKAVLMVSSDAVGEGMFVSQVAMHEKRPGHYVVRASKVLCDCSWLGEEHASLYPTPPALMAFLDRSPMQIVVYDQSVPARSLFEFHSTLGETIKEYPSRFELRAVFPISREGTLYPSGIKVYRIFGTNPAAHVEVDMRRMLNSTMTLNPK